MKNSKIEKFFAVGFLLLGGGILCLFNYYFHLSDIALKTWLQDKIPIWLFWLVGKGKDLREIADYEGGLLVALLMGIALVVMCVGLFIEKPVLFSTGSAIGAVVRVLVTFAVFYNLRDWGWRSPYPWLRDAFVSRFLLPIGFCFALFFGLLLLASINRRMAKKAGIIAAGMIILRLFLIIAFYYAQLRKFFVSSVAIITTILLASGAFLTGKVLAVIAPEKESTKPAHVQEESEFSNSLDVLTKMKQSLDGGIITQEEFDAKKKQLLGL